MKRVSVLLALFCMMLPLHAAALELSSALTSSAASAFPDIPAAKGLAPGDGPLLVNQPESSVLLNAFASHDFLPPNDSFDIFIADDFTAATDWLVGRLYTPGETTVIPDLSCVVSLNWQIYGDGGGKGFFDQVNLKIQ